MIALDDRGFYATEFPAERFSTEREAGAWWKICEIGQTAYLDWRRKDMDNAFRLAAYAEALRLVRFKPKMRSLDARREALERLVPQDLFGPLYYDTIKRPANPHAETRWLIGGIMNMIPEPDR